MGNHRAFYNYCTAPGRKKRAQDEKQQATATLSGCNDNHIQMQPRDGPRASKTGRSVCVENKVGLKDKPGHLLGVWLGPDPEERPAGPGSQRSLASDNDSQLKSPEL